MRITLEAISAVALLFLLLLPALQYSSLPDKIPTHFGPAGQPDAWRAKAHIWTLPAVGLVMAGLLTALSGYAGRAEARKSPPEFAEPRAALTRNLMAATKAHMLCLFAFLTQRTIDVAHGRAESLGPVFFILLALLIPLIGYFLIRRLQLR